MGMKLLPAVATFTCAALLISCGHKAAVTPADKDRQDEEYMARQQRQMLEREAALDERERLLVEREHKLGLTATTPAGRRLRRPRRRTATSGRRSAAGRQLGYFLPDFL